MNSESTHRWRIGSVPYLNAKPLIEGLSPDQLTFLPPKDLAEEFGKGNLDVALLPTFYLLQNKELRVVRGLGIGCEGTVLTVLVKPSSPNQISYHSLTASPESMTSNRLAEVIFKKYRGENIEWKESTTDGQVIIGDSALQFKAQNPTYPVIDLGDAWWNATELPFVFALWVIHPQVSGHDAKEISDLLHQSWIHGKAKLHTFAKNPLEFQYLSHYLRYECDDRFEQGIEKWQNDLEELGILKEKNIWKWI